MAGSKPTVNFGNGGGGTGGFGGFSFNDPSGRGLGDVFEAIDAGMDPIYGWIGNRLDDLYDVSIGDLTNTRDAFTGEDIKWIPELAADLATFLIPGGAAIKGAKAASRIPRLLGMERKGAKALSSLGDDAARIADAAKVLQTGDETAMTIAEAQKLMNQGKTFSNMPLYQFVDDAGNIAFTDKLGRAKSAIPEAEKSIWGNLTGSGAYNIPRLPKGSAVVKGDDNVFYAIPEAAASTEKTGLGSVIKGLLGMQKAPKATAPSIAKATKGGSATKTEKTVKKAAKEVKEAEEATQKVAETAAKEQKAAQATQASQEAQAANVSPTPQERAAFGSWSPVSEPVSRSIFSELRPQRLKSGRPGYRGNTFAEVLNRTSRSPKRRNRKPSK